MPIRFSPMTLDPSAAVEADIFVAEDGRPWRAPTWPSADGVAVILCPSSGELDDEGHYNPQAAAEAIVAEIAQAEN